MIRSSLQERITVDVTVMGQQREARLFILAASIHPISLPYSFVRDEQIWHLYIHLNVNTCYFKMGRLQLQLLALREPVSQEVVPKAHFQVRNCPSRSILNGRLLTVFHQIQGLNGELCPLR